MSCKPFRSERHFALDTHEDTVARHLQQRADLIRTARRYSSTFERPRTLSTWARLRRGVRSLLMR